MRGDGAPNAFGCVVIHRGHMRLLDLSVKQYQALFGQLEQAGRLAREVEAPFLDRTDLVGELLPSRPAPCDRPQTPCRAGLPHTEVSGNPALTPTLPIGSPLASRPVFKRGVYVQQVFAGWAGWSAGMEQQGFRAVPPVEYFDDPLSQSGPRPAFDLRDATVRQQLLAADVPNLWQFGTPCTTFCDYQRLNGGTRTVTCPEGDGTRADEVQGIAAEACLNLHPSGRLFAFESSAPSGATRRSGTCRVCVA